MIFNDLYRLVTAADRAALPLRHWEAAALAEEALRQAAAPICPLKARADMQRMYDGPLPPERRAWLKDNARRWDALHGRGK